MATQLPDSVRHLCTLTGHEGTIGRIGWSPDGRLLATPSTDGTVRIWNAHSGVCERIIRGHHSGVLAAAFDPDGRILATGGGDGTKLWNVDNGELRTTLDFGFCNAVAFSPHKRILATGNERSDVTLWELSTRTRAVQDRLTGHDDYVLGVAFDTGGLRARDGERRPHSHVVGDPGRTATPQA